MTTETDYQYLMRRLKESKGQYGVISRATGVPYFTVARLGRGANVPRATTVDALLGYFRAQETTKA